MNISSFVKQFSLFFAFFLLTFLLTPSFPSVKKESDEISEFLSSKC